jgi:hypothetical protein
MRINGSEFNGVTWRSHGYLRRLTICFIMLAQQTASGLNAFIRENDEIGTVNGGVCLWMA